MLAQYALMAIMAFFIIGMIWLRTRMHYARLGSALRLEPAGRIYFGSALGVLVTGWFAAPPLARLFWPGTALPATTLRVLWCLATYYLFIIVHRLVKSRGAAVFRPRDTPEG